MRRPIGAKFCTVISPKLDFVMPIQNFGGLPQKNFTGQKHAKFGLISGDFDVQRGISPERMKIFKIEQIFDLPRFPPHKAKKVQ